MLACRNTTCGTREGLWRWTDAGMVAALGAGKERGVVTKGSKGKGQSRSSVTGKFVTNSYANSHPRTTQTSHKKSK